MFNTLFLMHSCQSMVYWALEKVFFPFRPTGSQHLFRLGISSYKLFHYSSPYPSYYQTAFAFSSIPYPLNHPPSLRSVYHDTRGIHRVYHVPYNGFTMFLITSSSVSPFGEGGGSGFGISSNLRMRLGSLFKRYVP